MHELLKSGYPRELIIRQYDGLSYKTQLFEFLPKERHCDVVSQLMEVMTYFKEEPFFEPEEDLLKLGFIFVMSNMEIKRALKSFISSMLIQVETDQQEGD